MEAARPVRPEDVDDLDRLARTAREELAGERGGATLLAGLSSPEWSDLLGAQDVDVVVGTLDDVVVGFAVVCAPDGGDRAEVAALYVEPEAREVGVGEAILDLVVDLARRRGRHEVDVSALPGDRGTKNFLEGHGFKARLIVMSRAVDL